MGRHQEPLYRHRQLPLWFALMMVAFIGYGVFILLKIDSKQVFWLWNGFTILLAVFFWGLAVDGENGVYSVLEILRRELDMAMAFCGITRVPEIDGKILSWN